MCVYIYSYITLYIYAYKSVIYWRNSELVDQKVCICTSHWKILDILNPWSSEKWDKVIQIDQALGKKNVLIM